MNPSYDLIVRGGTVLDPVSGTAQRRDLFVCGGRLSDAPPAGDAEVLDAGGCCVSPGLIDAHGHFYTDGHMIGVAADTVCPSGCVTAAIDQGSAGIYNYDDFASHVLARTATDLYASLSITNTGVQMPPRRSGRTRPAAILTRFSGSFAATAAGWWA